MTKYTPEMNNSNNFKQPEALRLAYELQIKAKALGFSLDPHAAELRRLHAVNQELLEALKWMVENDDTNEGDSPIESLGGATWDEFNAYWISGLNKARAAIAKATGGAV